MQWFKHDTDAFADVKVRKLILRHGPEGYAVYFHCLELIAGRICTDDTTFELEEDAEIIADTLKFKGSQDKTPSQVVESIMRTIIDLGLLQESNDRIFCLKLIKRLDQSMTSNPKLRKIIDNGKKYHDTIMIPSCGSHEYIRETPDDVSDTHESDIDIDIDLDLDLDVDQEGKKPTTVDPILIYYRTELSKRLPSTSWPNVSKQIIALRSITAMTRETQPSTPIETPDRFAELVVETYERLKSQNNHAFWKGAAWDPVNVERRFADVVQAIAQEYERDNEELDDFTQAAFARMAGRRA